MTSEEHLAAKPVSWIADLRDREALAERVSILSHAPLFSVLHPVDRETLASSFVPVRYRRGDVIFREGEPADQIFLIGEGRVKLSIASDAGQELLIGFVGSGEIFGELEVIDRGPRAMDARATEDPRVYALDADQFWTMLEQRPALSRRLLELMARRLRRADATTQDLVFFDAPTRLARTLLRLAEEHGEQVSDGLAVRIAVRMTQEEVAQMIGVTRESANRLISTFAARGWIDWNEGFPILLHPESLLHRSR